MHKSSNTSPENRRIRIAKCLIALVWLTIIAVCLLHKDEFTLERILNYTPRQPRLAAAVLWGLFAVKSLSIFLYSGLLYAASGILFPLPVAIAVNIAGTAVMVSIPYWLGKKLGSQAVQYILHRWPKAATLHDLRSGSDFFFVLIVRLLGILSADVVSAYMGAVNVKYKCYPGHFYQPELHHLQQTCSGGLELPAECAVLRGCCPQGFRNPLLQGQRGQGHLVL